MNDAEREPASTREEIEHLLARVDEFATKMDVDRDQLLQPETVAWYTAIEPDRVIELLEGRGDPPQEEPADPRERDTFYEGLFLRRIQFLHKRRRLTRTATGVVKKASLGAIHRETLISKPQVGMLLNGDRAPNNDHAGRLEKYFRVDRGFCSLTEGQALVAYLRRILGHDLVQLALRDARRRMGVQSIGMRSSGELPEADLARAVLSTLEAVTALVEGRSGKSQDQPER
ncbi:hypothetical protein QF035_009031 [Streptomyces umbrinus]|uniref:Uncharacterized protein n=1 Tax=Streptomyces umbrinus TaxID=67370 RepID=A0ABU0T9H1_9ACTN|nr:hypothetical protein [Streptomyces umbrinus]MDQ1031449.1 hypothetical protein [Streptomyces umbrinus]